MIIKKRVDLGEYIVEIEYDETTGAIDVYVLDELEGVIESISITNAPDGDSENPDDPEDNPFNDYTINLN
jgi:hypothetical protein